MLTLCSPDVPYVLVENYHYGAMPFQLQNVADTPEELFRIIRDTKEHDLEVSKKDELIIKVAVGLNMKRLVFHLVKGYLPETMESAK
jgi:hypothetical protein